MLQELKEPSVPVSPSEQDVKFSNRFETNRKSGLADYLGMSGSVLCLIHCIAPQLIMIGSLGFGLAAFFSSGIWHVIFWGTCLAAVWQSGRTSAYPRIKVFLWFSFLVFTLGIGYEWMAQVEHWISYVGSLLLIIGHTINLVYQIKWRRFLNHIPIA